MQTRVIHKLWETYRKCIMSSEAPPIQISECQLAFYGGASAILDKVLELSNEEIPEEEAARELGGLLAEVKEFRDLILTSSKGLKS